LRRERRERIKAEKKAKRERKKQEKQNTKKAMQTYQKERGRLQSLSQSLYRKNRSVVLMQRMGGMPRHVIPHL
jgi:hypothetical protein